MTWVGSAVFSYEGRYDTPAKRKAMEAGFEHHLTKSVNPVHLETLLASIKPN